MLTATLKRSTTISCRQCGYNFDPVPVFMINVVIAHVGIR